MDEADRILNMDFEKEVQYDRDNSAAMLKFTKCMEPPFFDPFTPRSDQPYFSLSVSHQRYIIQYGELGI